MDKRGVDISIGRVVMILLTIIIFIFAFAYVSRASSGVGVYEQAYSKQIALLLDNAKPNTILEIDFEDGIKVAEKQKGKVLSYDEKKLLVQINNNEVVVSLTGGGYSTKYFTDYHIASDFNENKLVLVIT